MPKTIRFGKVLMHCRVGYYYDFVDDFRTLIYQRRALYLPMIWQTLVTHSLP